MNMSATILTKNCKATLQATLESLRGFSEVVVLDTGSTDETLAIAKAFPNVKIHSAEFKGFGALHNQATSLASHDWILSIDSDEVLTPELISELQSLQPGENCVYSLQRDNDFNGKKIRCCSGWYPDIVVRLYHRKKTQFSNDAVHERILTEGLQVVRLKGTLRHTPYRGMSDFLDKMQKYSTLFAEQRKGKERSSLGKALLHSIGAFLKSYLLKRGIFGGKEGFIISLYNSQTAYYKYLKLAELNKKV